MRIRVPIYVWFKWSQHYRFIDDMFLLCTAHSGRKNITTIIIKCVLKRQQVAHKCTMMEEVMKIGHIKEKITKFIKYTTIQVSEHCSIYFMLYDIFICFEYLEEVALWLWHTSFYLDLARLMIAQNSPAISLFLHLLVGVYMYDNFLESYSEQKTAHWLCRFNEFVFF